MGSVWKKKGYFLFEFLVLFLSIFQLLFLKLLFKLFVEVFLLQIPQTKIIFKKKKSKN